MNKTFEQEWSEKVEKVRQSRFWRQVSSPPTGRIERTGKKPRRDEVAVDAQWSLELEGDFAADGTAHLGLEDLHRFLRSRFGLSLRRKSRAGKPRLVFALVTRDDVSRWDSGFELNVDTEGIEVRAASQEALLRASL